MFCKNIEKFLELCCKIYTNTVFIVSLVFVECTFKFIGNV